MRYNFRYWRPRPLLGRHSSHRIDTWLRAVEQDGLERPPVIESAETPTSEKSIILEPVAKRIIQKTLAEYELDSFDLEAFKSRERDTPIKY